MKVLHLCLEIMCRRNQLTFSGTGWSNTEYRTYELMACDKDDVRFLESAESRQRRAKTAPVPTRETQKALHEKAQQTWKAQGYLLCAEEREAPFFRIE